MRRNARRRAGHQQDTLGRDDAFRCRHDPAVGIKLIQRPKRRRRGLRQGHRVRRGSRYGKGHGIACPDVRVDHRKQDLVLRFGNGIAPVNGAGGRLRHGCGFNDRLRVRRGICAGQRSGRHVRLRFRRGINGEVGRVCLRHGQGRVGSRSGRFGGGNGQWSRDDRVTGRCIASGHRDGGLFVPESRGDQIGRPRCHGGQQQQQYPGQDQAKKPGLAALDGPLAKRCHRRIGLGPLVRLVRACIDVRFRDNRQLPVAWHLNAGCGDNRADPGQIIARLTRSGCCGHPLQRPVRFRDRKLCPLRAAQGKRRHPSWPRRT